MILYIHNFIVLLSASLCIIPLQCLGGQTRFTYIKIHNRLFGKEDSNENL